MNVLALDLASTTGWAYGPAERDVKPRVGTWDLRAKHEWLVPGNLAMELRKLFREHGPCDAMFIEATLPVFGQKSQKTAKSQERLHGAALGIAGIYSVPHIEEIAPSTVRKHFCGRANAGERFATKRMVMRRAKDLGYDCANDDVADAVALWDFAVFAALRVPQRDLVMF